MHPATLRLSPLHPKDHRMRFLLPGLLALAALSDVWRRSRKEGQMNATLVLCLLLWAVAQAVDAGESKMNVVSILADDLGWSDTTLYTATTYGQSRRPAAESALRSGHVPP